MKIHDISREIKEGMVVWKNRDSKRPKFTVTAEYSKDHANESRIDMDMHTGTHADAYFHMLKDGEKIGGIPLDRFIGKCRVLDMTRAKGMITEKDLNGCKIKKGEIILLKTRNRPEREFDSEFAFVGREAAAYLAKKKIKTLGVDSLGVERNQAGHDTHKILFSNGIAVIEGLELSGVKPGDYFLVALPLRINADASPVRAVLVEGIGK
ncbi:cyclase family protein [Candidatus Woesearchaeota archaeon]|nr:cyclase family protein [Candidatus Woesearchaeota archaeon]MBI2130841.1 cyclase family protein [Candidatus Woesearchaeota archaeon]